MASHLGEIFGTELDKVNCPFYFKMGACRHGDKCSRLHNQPVVSQTILIPHMYLNPSAAPMVDEHGKPIEYDRRFLRDHFEEFFEDTYEELSKYGDIEELQVVDNVCEHLLGNVYVRYTTEDMAEQALKNLQGRYYAGRLLTPEFSPVTDFRDARCRQYEEDECTRGGLCNFMHLKHVSRSLKKELQRMIRKSKRSRSRSGDREEKKKRSKEERGERSERKEDRDRERGDRDRSDRKSRH